MDPITVEQVEEALLNLGRMRTGRQLGRTLYLEINKEKEVCIGMVDSPYIAHKLANLWNQQLGR